MDFVDRVTDRKQRREHDAMHVRMKSRNILRDVALDVYARQLRETDALLAIGAACPWSEWWQREIWLDEVRARFYADQA
jgi:hypothetical protein